MRRLRGARVAEPDAGDVWSEDVTITGGLGPTRLILSITAILLVAAVGAAWIASGNWADALAVAALTSPLWAGVGAWCLVQLGSARPGSLVCTVEGLRYVLWFRPRVIPWPQITDVYEHLEARVNDSALLPGREVTIIHRTWVLCGTRRVRVSHRSNVRHELVVAQIESIRNWHDRFASPALPASPKRVAVVDRAESTAREST